MCPIPLQCLYFPQKPLPYVPNLYRFNPPFDLFSLFLFLGLLLHSLALCPIFPQNEQRPLNWDLAIKASPTAWSLSPTTETFLRQTIFSHLMCKWSLSVSILSGFVVSLIFFVCFDRNIVFFRKVIQNMNHQMFICDWVVHVAKARL